MTRKQIEKFLSSYEHIEGVDTVLLMDGLDAAFVGLDLSDPPRAVYSVQRAIKQLSKQMTEEQAIEYFDFNVRCAWVGPQTPILIETP